jgi:5-methylcytosine-specific restriction protein A
VTAKLADPGRQLPWRKFYGLQLWKDLRAHQLQIEPLCRLCKQRGQITAAVVADHIVDHHGDWNAFRLGPLQSLCEECHERKHNRLGPALRASKAVDDDGLPIDPRHPFNRQRKDRGSIENHAPPSPASPRRTT